MSDLLGPFAPYLSLNFICLLKSLHCYFYCFSIFSPGIFSSAAADSIVYTKQFSCTIFRHEDMHFYLA